jgi:hypothetical protein
MDALPNLELCYLISCCPRLSEGVNRYRYILLDRVLWLFTESRLDGRDLWIDAATELRAELRDHTNAPIDYLGICSGPLKRDRRTFELVNRPKRMSSDHVIRLNLVRPR